MKKVLLDASVLVRMVVREELSEVAARILEDFVAGKVEVYTTDLALYESANALLLLAKRGVKGTEKAVDWLSRIPFPAVRILKEDLPIIHRLASERGLTVYDASYVYHAWKNGLVLVSADEELVEKAKGFPVCRLEDYGSLSP